MVDMFIHDNIYGFGTSSGITKKLEREREREREKQGERERKREREKERERERDSKCTSYIVGIMVSR